MKNILKSAFISLFPTVAIFIVVTTFVTSDLNRISIPKIGLLISSATVIFFFLAIFIKKKARTSKNLLPFTSFIAIGFLLTLIQFDTTNFLLSFLIVIGWFLYLYWYSSFSERTKNSLNIGKKLPNFSLQNTKNETIQSDSFLGKFSVYLFYRGNWCPFCMAQINELVAEYKEIEKRDIQLIMISSQPAKFTEKLAKKHNVPIHFLIDKNNNVAKQLHILDKNGLPLGFQVLGYDSDIVLPTIIITDRKGKIIFSDLTTNYRIRPEPADFLAVIDAYQE